MSGKNRVMEVVMLVLLAAEVAVPMYAGSAVLGSGGGADAATLGARGARGGGGRRPRARRRAPTREPACGSPGWAQ